jgi:hypothetical protein
VSVPIAVLNAGGIEHWVDGPTLLVAYRDYALSEWYAQSLSAIAERVTRVVHVCGAAWRLTSVVTSPPSVRACTAQG